MAGAQLTFFMVDDREDTQTPALRNVVVRNHERDAASTGYDLTVLALQDREGNRIALHFDTYDQCKEFVHSCIEAAFFNVQYPFKEEG